MGEAEEIMGEIVGKIRRNEREVRKARGNEGRGSRCYGVIRFRK